MSADDTALLDNAEHSVMENWEKITIEFERLALPGRSGGWQVSYRMHSIHEDKPQGKSVLARGGGETLRAAFENALIERTIKRLGR